MEHKLLPKTSLFDQISFLMVGAIATILAVLDAMYFFGAPEPRLELGPALVWLLFAYFAGHLIQVVSNIIRDIPVVPLLDWETKLHYLPHEHRLLEEAGMHFDATEHGGHADRLWNLCYVFAMNKDAANQVETFSAYYNLYRGWSVVFLLETVFLAFMYAMTPAVGTALAGVVSFALSVLFYRRAKRFWQYLRDKVFGIFTLARAAKL